jgi:hypothetical protein
MPRRRCGTNGGESPLSGAVLPHAWAHERDVVDVVEQHELDKSPLLVPVKAEHARD